MNRFTSYNLLEYTLDALKRGAFYGFCPHQASSDRSAAGSSSDVPSLRHHFSGGGGGSFRFGGVVVCW